MTSCPGDCGGGMTACNNDGICDYDEDMESCPSDCGGTWTGCGSYQDEVSCLGAGGCVYCPGETWPCYMEGHVCGSDMNADVCGDGNCTGSETSTSCPSDCDVSSYCGDGMCDSNEDSYSCESDCGVPYVDDGSMTCTNWVDIGSSCDPTAGTCCTNGMCSNMNGPGICEDMGAGDGYIPPSDNGWCGDGVCDSTESSDWCPEDCGTVQGASIKRDVVSKYNPFNLLKPILSFFSNSN